MRFTLAAAISIGLLSAPPAWAQQPADPATMELAKSVVAKTQGDKAALLGAVTEPMIAHFSSMTLLDRNRSEIIVREAIIPVLEEDYDGMLAIVARAFVEAFSREDLQAIADFYDTPAGKRLSAAQPALAKAYVNGLAEWQTAAAPKIQRRVEEAVQRHGWRNK